MYNNIHLNLMYYSWPCFIERENCPLFPQEDNKNSCDINSVSTSSNMINNKLVQLPLRLLNISLVRDGWIQRNERYHEEFSPNEEALSQQVQY